jgi:type I restriction enzyme M protein
VLRKSKAENKTLFIDASAEFVRGSAKNKLSPDTIGRIMEAVKARCNTEHFCVLVDNAKIAENDYNLSAGTYVAKKDMREVVDIKKFNAQTSKNCAAQ